jgi:hypothetical protein
LHHLIEAWPEHNIVSGSVILAYRRERSRSVKLIRSNPKLSEPDKQRILVGNARRLFAL